MKGAKLFWALFLTGGAATATITYFVGDPILRILFGGERSYIVSSISMEPTLRQGERFLRQPVATKELRRGDLVTIRVIAEEGETFHLKRIAGLPGDIIQLDGGVVTIDGTAAKQTKVGAEKATGSSGPTVYHRLREQFPGESQPHDIYDERFAPGDNLGPVIVPAGYLFLLGDNRDNAADSRFSEMVPGSGMLKIGNVTGRVTKIYWSNDGSRIGRVVY